MVVKKIENMEEFQKMLKENSLVVVDFYADWCGPCRMISPKIEAFSEQYGNIAFCKVNVDEAEDVAQEANISAMPTFHFYRGGDKVGEVVGASEEKVKAEINKL